MNLLGALSFATPLALAALLLLPVIWWLLRFTPPRPETVRFPAIRLLLGLKNREEKPDKTPWWLLLLRLALAALVIIGVSQPLYAPGRIGTLTNTPVLVVVDDSWAAAKDWDQRREVMAEILDNAAAAGATVTLATTTPELRPQALEPKTAADVKARAAALAPRAFDPDRLGTLDRLAAAFGKSEALRVIWLSDGIDDGKAQDFAVGLQKLANGAAVHGATAACPRNARFRGWSDQGHHAARARWPGANGAGRRHRGQWPQLRRCHAELRRRYNDGSGSPRASR